MSDCYNLDGIKTELKKQLAKNELFLELWQKVSFPTKKDGKPFANMAKNFDGAHYGGQSYAMQPGENILKVGDFCKMNGYVSDEISCYQLVKYLKDETKKNKTENYMPKTSYLEQVYCYDLDDIKEAITDRIEYLKCRIASLKKQIEIAQQCFDAFKLAYSAAVEELKLDCSEAGSAGFSGDKNDLFYAVFDTVKERYPYC